MKNLRYTLITDGSSDKAFVPILNWILKEDLKIDCAIQDKWADLRKLPYPPKAEDLAGRITDAIDLYPCDLLFVHRDAEKETREKRLQEIRQAIEKANIDNFPIVCVIPIRMLEAWLLFDEAAIRKAAGNPKGKCQIQLPALNKVENLPDPKTILIEVLKRASELKGKKLRKFNARERIHRLADIIDDFSYLDRLSAYRVLKKDLLETLEHQGWL